jgi:hypothetical protein
MERIMLIFSFKGVQEDMILLHSFKAIGCHLTNPDCKLRSSFPVQLGEIRENSG